MGTKVKARKRRKKTPDVPGSFVMWVAEVHLTGPASADLILSPLTCPRSAADVLAVDRADWPGEWPPGRHQRVRVVPARVEPWEGDDRG